MRQAKNILLTFDYEPFLGAKSGTAERCMLKPTEALRIIMNRYNAKAVFFVDTLYLLHLKEHPELHKDFYEIEAQLQKLHAEGHYIFPHIHPHWLDAAYLTDVHQFSLTELSRYSLASLASLEIKGLFQDSIRCLKEMGITYPKWGYRAGGWCIQPFSSLKDIFISENIVFDFSVLPGCKNDSPNQTFDFSMVPNDTPYLFSDEVEQPDKIGAFTEFPISTIRYTQATGISDRIIRKYLWRKGDKGWGDGMGAQATPVKFNNANQEMVSIELLNRAKFSGYKKYLKKEEYMHWISHPKMFTKHGLKMFDRFLKLATENYDLNFDFQKMIKSR